MGKVQYPSYEYNARVQLWPTCSTSVLLTQERNCTLQRGMVRKREQFTVASLYCRSVPAELNSHQASCRAKIPLGALSLSRAIWAWFELSEVLGKRPDK